MELDDITSTPRTLDEACNALKQLDILQQNIDSRRSLARADKMVMEQLQKEADHNTGNTALAHNVQEWRKNIEKRLAKTQSEDNAVRNRKIDITTRINSLNG